MLSYHEDECQHERPFLYVDTGMFPGTTPTLVAKGAMPRESWHVQLAPARDAWGADRVMGYKRHTKFVLDFTVLVSPKA